MGGEDGAREELRSAWLYRVLASEANEPRKRELFTRLADAATRQASLWAERQRAQGTPAMAYEPEVRVRLVAWLVRRLGARAMLPVLAALKIRGLSVLTHGTPGHPMPTTVGAPERGHRGVHSGGSLRAAVFGVNDGLVSNTSLILGVAGAQAEPRTIVITGCAGVLAGAFSMAAGEWVSVRSQRELFERQIALERAELDEYPEEETEEVALIYQARGLGLDEARDLAARVMRDREAALDTLAREELGLNPADLGSPWRAAASSFLAFAVGAFVPLAPFTWTRGEDAILGSAAAAAIALVLVGAALSLFTGRNALWSGLRMLLIGGSAAAATFAVGKLFGVAVQ